MTGIYLVDHYANNKNYFFQKMSAYPKLIFFITVLASIIFTENILFLFFILSLLVLFSLVAKIPVFNILKWAFYPAFFASIFSFSQYISTGVFPFLFLLRAYIAAFLALFYSFTTPYFETFGIISKISPFLATILFLTYRYFFLFFDIIKKKFIMMKVRGGKKRRVKTAGKIMGFVILEMVNRSERIYSALKIRGFKGKILFNSDKKVKPGDLPLIFCGFLILIINFYLL